MARTHRTRRTAAAFVATIMTTATLATGGAALADIPAGTEFYVPKPNHGAVEQIAQLISNGDKADAAAIRAMVDTPQAVWIESNSPQEAERQVRQVTRQAAGKGTVPVLVAYNIPFRDCAQFSAGGATTIDEYEAWIDGVAAGIGDREAIVILEPDGLGIIPWYTNLDGQLEWCQPDEADPATAAAERFHMMNHAVDALTAQPGTSVYLDATHSGWLNVGDATDRLLKGGVERADGFFLNASNYQWTENSVQYGTWISSCLALVTEVNPGAFGDCGNQYWAGGPANNWGGDWPAGFGGALDSSLIWSDDAADPAANTAGINSRYDLVLGGVEPTTGFVVDTSRNGQGPWSAPQGVYPDPQDWCNPPDRGLGLRPTTDTGSELAEAFLWIKIPGESDGECDRGTGAAVDPVRGVANPPAGHWFADQALELAQLADPPLDAGDKPGRGLGRN